MMTSIINKNEEKDAIIVGGGPAGMAMAIALREQGVERILIIEREESLGGVLNQCIHDGFGLLRFEKNLTGPEYRDVFYKKLIEKGIEFQTAATVIKVQTSINYKNSRHIEVSYVGKNGETKLLTKSLVIATGARERSRGSILVPGTRPSGIFTAGAVQNMMNVGNMVPGSNAVILGSGDIGLLMARRLTLEGIKLACIVEKEKSPTGLPRNIKQCVEDFQIPVMLSSTVTNIIGNSRITAVEISQIDENGEAIKGSEKIVDCDTLILSVGLIPENEVALTANVEVDSDYEPIVNDIGETNINGVFVTGNARFIHDLVDKVSQSAELQAIEVSRYIAKGAGTEDNKHDRYLEHGASKEARRKDKERNKEYHFMKEENSLVCILCPNSCIINYHKQDERYIVTGGMCTKGKDYVLEEILNPMRILTSTVKINNSKRELASVRTTLGIPKEKLMHAMKIIKKIKLEEPVIIGDIIIKDFISQGVDLIATGSSLG